MNARKIYAKLYDGVTYKRKYSKFKNLQLKMETESANNKRIAKNALLLYFRMFITMAVSLYTSRVILKALGVEDFGIYNVVGGVVTMLTFINTAMGSASQRYITFELGHKNYKQLYTVFVQV